MWSLLIEPVTFLDHLKGSECLLCLIVVIELPRQIADEKQEKAYGGNDPNVALIFKQASCHVEPSRLARRNFMRRRKTFLILNVHGFDSLIPFRSTSGLPIYVAASPAAPFS